MVTAGRSIVMGFAWIIARILQAGLAADAALGIRAERIARTHAMGVLILVPGIPVVSAEQSRVTARATTRARAALPSVRTVGRAEG